MSPDEDMTKEQLISEVAGLRQRLAELEVLETERKRAEEALQESEERIHTIVSNAPVVIWSLDKEGIFTLSEGAGLKALGLRPGEVVGQSVFDVYHDVPQICEDNRRALAGETFVSIIEVEELVFEAHYSPIRDKSGEVNGIVGVATDITERKRVEETLRESEERYRILFESELEGVVVIDETMKPLLANKAAANIMGFDSVEELLESNLLDFIVPEERERVIRIMAEDMFEDNLRQVNEFRVMKKSGEEVWISAIGTVTEYQGKPAGLASFRDITERRRVEEALKESEYRFRRLFEESNDAVFIHDFEGRLLDVNDAASKMLGYSKDELMKMLIPTLHQEEELTASKGAFQTTMKKGSVRFETKFRKSDGTMIDVDISSRIVDRGREVIQGIVRDITERKRAEEALREGEERYRALVDLGGRVGEAIVMVQDTERGNAIHTFVSNEWPRVTGYSQKELLDMSFFDLLHPRYRQASIERYGRKMRGEIIPGLFEMSIVRKDGTEVPVEVTSASTTYRGERANVAFIRDITERKQAEESLRLQAEIIANMSEGVYLVGADDGVVHYTNPKFEAMFGYEPGGMVGKHVSMVNAPTDKSPEETAREIMGIIRKTGEWHGEVNNIRKDGTPFWCYVNVSVFNHPEYGEVLVAIHTDITERRQAEEREQEVQQELNISRHLVSIGELAAGVAHEINNPLTGILGFSERLMKKSVSQEISRDLERIRNEAQRAARVVGNLLTFARRREPRKEYLDVNEILAKTVELRAYQLRTGNIKLEVELASSLPEIVGDFGQIQQVFLNIILNAEQAMAEANRGGKLSIKTQKAKGCIRISFADDGPGIPAENRDRVFDPFFTTRGDRGGTGLGLSASHGIVTEHGGRIYARSKPGQGATFFVELPLKAEGIDKRKVAEKKSVRRG